MKKLIIFDMDGVLVNSEPYHISICDVLVRELSNGKIGAKEAHTVGISTVELYRRALDMVGAEGDPVAITYRHFVETFERIKRDIPSPDPSVTETLDELARRGVRMAIATSSPRWFVEKVLSLYGIYDRFETIVTCDDIVNRKPAPDCYLEALRRCDVAAADAAAVEDSHAGMRAALNAKLYCYGFVNPDSGNQDLTDADCRIHDLRELLD